MFLVSTVLNPSSKLITAMTHGNAVLEPPSVMFSRWRMYTQTPVPNNTNSLELAHLNSVGKREHLIKKTKNDEIENCPYCSLPGIFAQMALEI